MKYQPTIESLRTHVVPDWYHNAKLGIMITWGLYSVPAWAPYSELDIMEMVAREGFSANKKSPYVAWYLNSMQFKDSPTWKHHVETYGEHFPYDDFRKPFEEASAKMDPDAWAEFFQEAGARYVVFITKHHDGYLLWPSNYRHPFKTDYQSKRDFVGELTEAVRRKNMRMGLYYSGVWDWSFTHTPIDSVFSFVMNMRQSRQYVEYANNHIRELIDRYKPSILWNDIGYPAGTDVNELIAYYYNTVKDGVVNDRWSQIKVPNNSVALASMKAALELMEKEMQEQNLTMMEPRCHYDFRTPEYTSFKEILTEKWETVRGIGKSFEYNQIEDEKIILSSGELIRYLTDIVSKNGNLLIGVGPKADGTFSELHQKPLRELGAWLKVNGEAIFDTRPWKRAEGKTEQGMDVRFTKKAESLYATVLDIPRGKEISLKNLKAADDTEVFLLGHLSPLQWKQEGDSIKVTLPGSLWESAAYSFKIIPQPE